MPEVFYLGKHATFFESVRDSIFDFNRNLTLQDIRHTLIVWERLFSRPQCSMLW